MLAKSDIISLLSQVPQKVYSETQLADVLHVHRRPWRLPDSTTASLFISFLTKQGDLRAHKFRSEKYEREITRYSWGKVSHYDLALALKPRAYLCHATALTLQGLAKLSPKTIYLNVEQSPKPSYPGSLTQRGIELAFSGAQRQSSLVYTNGGVSVIMIAGKNTKQLGVEEVSLPDSRPLSVTNLERTLIDIVVRPAYAGGITQVLKAYRAAKERLSGDLLLAILKKLDYVYPYHQAIGFLMQTAGYPEEAYSKFRTLGLSHDFYLTHDMHDPKYSREWRLHYPQEFKPRRAQSPRS
jgi:hypothetical protein